MPMLKLLNLYPKTIADFKDLEINADTSKVSQEELLANLDKSISLSEECLKSLNAIRAVIDRKVIILLSFLIGYLSLLSLNFPSILKFGQHYPGMGIKFVYSIGVLAIFYLIIAIYVAIIGFAPKGEVIQGAEPKELAGIINLNNDIYKLTWLSRLQKKISYNGYIVTRYSKLLSYAVLATVLAPALSLCINLIIR